MERIKILLYGDIVMNIIDGSSVWVTSMLNVLSTNDNIELTLLLKSPIETRELIDSIQHLDHIRLVEPTGFGKNGYSFQPVEALNAIEKLDAENNYDLILIRGIRVCKLVPRREVIQKKSVCYVTEIKPESNDITPEDLQMLRDIYDNCLYFCVQTPEAKAKFMSLLGLGSDEKIIYLLPMVPDYASEAPDFTNQNNTLVYSGKFSAVWYSHEWVKGFEEAYEQNHSIRLNAAGNKFHDDLGECKAHIQALLATHPNVDWGRGVSRIESTKIIEDSDVGIAWRSPEVDNDNALEISTKVLEYSRAGKPILVRRTKMYEDLLGKDYPLFVEDRADFVDKVLQVFSDPFLYEKSARAAYNNVKPYTFKERYKYLHPFICKALGRKTNLLFAGHDFKFLQQFIDYCASLGKYNIRLDQWKGHSKHDETQSKDCLQWADIIFCEWGLGNLAWYSQRKKPHQKLFARMHLQERDTAYSKSFSYDNIDRIFTISPFMFEEFSYKLNIPREKMKIIYTWVDCQSYNKLKTNDSKFNLGIVGISPKRKRFDLALDLLERLWEKDKRYRLFVKGKHPSEYEWLWERPYEKAYYDAELQRIAEKPWGAQVVFDGFGADMDEWFTKIGYILSPSDYEGTHVSVAEGMASGAVPVIRNREDAYSVFGYDFICHTLDDAVDYVLGNRDSVESERYKQFAERFDCHDKFVALLNSMGELNDSEKLRSGLESKNSTKRTSSIV